MSIKIIIKNGEEFDRVAADFVTGGVIAFPTGKTPIGMYEELKKRPTEWAKIIAFMLDVNYPQDPAEPDSFSTFAKKYIPKDKIFILNSASRWPAQECASYESKIKKYGGLDLAILGIGSNGHIAYNEPWTRPEQPTHLTDLSPETIAAGKLKTKQGLTMGIKTIMAAKKILLLAKGADKAGAVKAALAPPPRLDCPASWLQNHPDCTFLIDRAAAGKL